MKLSKGVLILASILVVEDEKAINDLVCSNLTMMGHSCFSALCGREGVAMAREHSFDLLILDVMLPDIDGFAVLENVRNVPAIFLTTRSGASDKVRGFSLGADDYITKPFLLTELLLRVTAVLRRTQKQDTVYRIDGLEVQFDAKQVYLRGEAVELTLQEFNLLQVLIEHRNIALSRQKLLTEAWGVNFMGESRTVAVHIQKLRKKLELEDRIKTVYKVGYRFEDK